MYQASEEDMKEYAAIVAQIGALDVQREQLLQRLAKWEKEHLIEDTSNNEDMID